MQQTIPPEVLVSTDDAGKRLDQFLASRLEGVSRARVQELISQRKILVNGSAAKPSLKLSGGETIRIVGEAQRPPLKAFAEDIPIEVIFEDEDLAVINKPAGMMVHAGAGGSDEVRSHGTLVNALLHHMHNLSGVGGELRPGIVHRLDKETSGLMVVAKNDGAHARLAEQFAARTVKKKYIALVHGWVKNDSGTIDHSISRDPVRRKRMTAKVKGGRTAITHYRVVRRVNADYGKFTLLDVKIDTGRTHQIRVHMAGIGHPVVGDTLYGAPKDIRRKPNSGAIQREPAASSQETRSRSVPGVIELQRNFLHSAEIEFRHPRTGETLSLKNMLAPELQDFLRAVGGSAVG